MPINEILEALLRQDIRFPLITIPDIGMKAFGVYIIKDMDSLQSYMQRISIDFLIQELIEFPKEVGIFYIRLLTEKKDGLQELYPRNFYRYRKWERFYSAMDKTKPKEQFQ